MSDDQVSLNYKQRETRSTRASTWMVLTIAGIVVWMLTFTALFQLQDSRLIRWVWGFLGPFIWSVPLGIALAKSVASRWHALWIGSAAYPLNVLVMYVSMLGAATFPHLAVFYDALDWHEQPGRELMQFSLTLAGIPTVITTITFLGWPRRV
jgi:hypothetical protein